MHMSLIKVRLFFYNLVCVDLDISQAIDEKKEEINQIHIDGDLCQRRDIFLTQGLSEMIICLHYIYMIILQRHFFC